ncbi:uncharacterized protein LOC110265111 [Arachis ipaensis]|uniref:uncharacterized protein LOC110265111 n=1 Tax=Arachis ipaensis TaxID=130454 RepID=UPI000A2AFE48|nr:uncharacterized protein LOC110265111 [Arachis ipaensis]
MRDSTLSSSSLLRYLQYRKKQGKHGEESVDGCASSDKEGLSRDDFQKVPKVSFRDKVIGTARSKAFVLVGSLSGDGIATAVDKQGDSQPQCVSFRIEAKTCLTESHREALVIKVLNKKYSYTALSHKLRVVWRIKGGFTLLDVGFRYFLIKFDVVEDREKVMLDRPWLIEGHYVAVKLWDVDFQLSE